MAPLDLIGSSCLAAARILVYRSSQVTRTILIHANGQLTLPRLKAGDSRFSAAAYATAPRRARPALSMFLAAL